ncbi:MAG: hypothetical protein ACHQ7M_00860, partial [Chloroflexota bacterium]
TMGSSGLVPMVAVFGATFVYFVNVSFLLATLHYPTDWGGILLDVAVPAALANGILSLIVYPVFAFVAAHTSRQVRVEF